MKAIVGTKVGMTQIFAEDQLIPVTVILAGPCPVVQKKTLERDGYSAVQLGFDSVRRVNKPLAGHFKKHSGAAPQRHLIEVRNMQAEGEVKVDIFREGELVDVSGTSKGRGTAGVMKRHGFSGGSASHGNEGWHRRPGSIGQRKTPGRVYKGKRMAGHYGGARVTSIGLEVVQVRPEENLLLVKGSVPGPSGGLVVVRQSSRRRAA